ncbi:hypothetical protein D3C74_293960 [compost metagenome]
MGKSLFPSGIIKVEIDGAQRLGEYMGRQDGFECVVCGKGEKCFTFNLFDNEAEYAKGNYETLGFGRNHLNYVKLIQE